MKTCVFILGTNCVGKTTLARAIIARFGGVALYEDSVTCCRDCGVCLAGRYREGGKFGGVDGLKSKSGSSGTSMLANAVEHALRKGDTVFCEGSYMNTFGLNLTNAMFKAERHLVVGLYADAQTIASRLETRSGGLKKGFGLTLNKQRQMLSAARKWQSVGIRVMLFDTGRVPVTDVLNKVVGVLGL